MHTEYLITLIRFLSFALVLCILGYKYYDHNRLRKTRLYVKLRLFTFYKHESIVATSSSHKRRFMARGNLTTALVLGCILPNSMLGVYDLANLFKNYLDTLS